MVYVAWNGKNRWRKSGAQSVLRLTKQWVEKLVDEDYTVIDIGNPSNKGESVFYNMEQGVIFK